MRLLYLPISYQWLDENARRGFTEEHEIESSQSFDVTDDDDDDDEEEENDEDENIRTRVPVDPPRLSFSHRFCSTRRSHTRS